MERSTKQQLRKTGATGGKESIQISPALERALSCWDPSREQAVLDSLLADRPRRGALEVNGQRVNRGEYRKVLALFSQYGDQAQSLAEQAIKLACNGNVIQLEIKDCPRLVMDRLSQLQHLQSLTLENVGLSDLAAVENLTSLKTLAVPANQIRDLKPLAHLRALKFLDLSRNQIADISPLTALPIRQIDLRSNPLQGHQALVDQWRRQTVDVWLRDKDVLV